MEDQKKSIVYLLQGLAGNIRNKMNWQLQGYLCITLKSFEKAVRINTHLNSGPQYDTDFILDGLYNYYNSFNYEHPNIFLSAFSLITCKQ